MSKQLDFTAARIAREDAALIADGYMIPREGTVVPTRSEFVALIQELVESANGDGVEQPLAERLAQYLDAIYGALPGGTPNE